MCNFLNLVISERCLRNVSKVVIYLFGTLHKHEYAKPFRDGINTHRKIFSAFNKSKGNVLYQRDRICRIEVKKQFKLNILILHFETQLYVMSAHTSGVMKWRGIKIISSRKKFQKQTFLESEYTLRIKRLGELLIKESDKIKCVCFNLNLAGNAR